MTSEVVPYQNGIVNGDLASANPSSNKAASKKSRESKRRRRRRKQKKNNKASDNNKLANGNESDDESTANGDDAKEKSETQQIMEQIEIEYVPEKAELEDGMDNEFRKIFEKFSFSESADATENDSKDEAAQNADSKKKADSDSDGEKHEPDQRILFLYCQIS
ncbi:uncharacterized protein [Euphorbia lathyris]|uniref:uncharacterized protein n=1 Tax=Euphorbia lathyris TaxID=212925 RepID=UPI0033142166